MRQAQGSEEKCPAPPAFSREVMRAQERRESHASRKPCARKRDRASAMVYPRAKAVTAREPKDEETAMTEIDTATQTELEAAVFRRLVAHLQTRSDVPEYRPHEHGRLLPQLPVELDEGRRRRARPGPHQGRDSRARLRNALRAMEAAEPGRGHARATVGLLEGASRAALSFR